MNWSLVNILTKIELFPFPLKKFSWFFIKILGIVEKNFKKMQIDF